MFEISQAFGLGCKNDPYRLEIRNAYPDYRTSPTDSKFGMPIRTIRTSPTDSKFGMPIRTIRTSPTGSKFGMPIRTIRTSPTGLKLGMSPGPQERALQVRNSECRLPLL